MKKLQVNLKIEITKFVMQELGLALNEPTFKKAYRAWWQNPRLKEKGGLKLTEAGYNSFKKANIKEYKISAEKSDEVFCNKHVIWLDNMMDGPWYIDNENIYVFDEKMAIQLTLFQGNLIRFSTAKARNATYT